MEFVFALSQHLTGFQSMPNNLVALPSRTEEGGEQVSHMEIQVQVYVDISSHTLIGLCLDHSPGLQVPGSTPD